MYDRSRSSKQAYREALPGLLVFLNSYIKSEKGSPFVKPVEIIACVGESLIFCGRTWLGLAAKLAPRFRLCINACSLL